MEQFKEAAQETAENETGRWVLIACFARAIGTNSLAYYSAIYFTQIYPDYTAEFGIANAAVYVFVASLSSLAGGFLADKLTDSNKLNKSYICAGSTALALPLISFALLKQDDFLLAYTALAVHYVFSEAWVSPSLSMLQNTSSKETQGFVASIYNLALSLAALSGTTVLGKAQ